MKILSFILGMIVAFPAFAQNIPSAPENETKILQQRFTYDLGALDGAQAAKQRIITDIQAMLDYQQRVIEWYEKDDAGLRQQLNPVQGKK